MIKLFLIESIPLIIPLSLLVMVVGFFIFLWIQTFHPKNKNFYHRLSFMPIDDDKNQEHCHEK